MLSKLIDFLFEHLQRLSGTQRIGRCAHYDLTGDHGSAALSEILIHLRGKTLSTRSEWVGE